MLDWVQGSKCLDPLCIASCGSCFVSILPSVPTVQFNKGASIEVTHIVIKIVITSVGGQRSVKAGVMKRPRGRGHWGIIDWVTEDFLTCVRLKITTTDTNTIFSGAYEVTTYIREVKSLKGV